MIFVQQVNILGSSHYRIFYDNNFTEMVIKLNVIKKLIYVVWNG